MQRESCPPVKSLNYVIANSNPESVILGHRPIRWQSGVGKKNGARWSIVHLFSIRRSKKENYLQLILEELVHPGHLCGNAKIDCSVADFDDKTAADFWVDLESVSNSSVE